MVHLPILFVAAASLAQSPEDYTAPKPTHENRSVWQTFVLPRAQEVLHESIPWLHTFGEGVLAAHDQGKPLLLWTMNGHPLGCT